MKVHYHDNELLTTFFAFFGYWGLINARLLFPLVEFQSIAAVEDQQNSSIQCFKCSDYLSIRLQKKWDWEGGIWSRYWISQSHLSFFVTGLTNGGRFSKKSDIFFAVRDGNAQRNMTLAVPMATFSIREMWVSLPIVVSDTTVLSWPDHSMSVLTCKAIWWRLDC